MTTWNDGATATRADRRTGISSPAESAGSHVANVSSSRGCASGTQGSRAADTRGPVAIVDIGSNSVRLVIYERQSRNAATLQNEKSICGSATFCSSGRR